MDRLYSLKQNIKSKLLSYHANINWIVFILIVIFTIGSWLDLNGMWCELPLMVYELPEGWRLPAIIGAIIQFSQLGSLIFFIFKYSFPKRLSLVFVIYLIFIIGAMSCLPLAFLWDKTVLIGNERRSIALYILTFTLGLLDGTSSVTFLPYIGHYFKKEYIIANYVGESLSAMLPSILGIIQGVGKTDQSCKEINSTMFTSSNDTRNLVKVTYANKTKYYMQLPLDEHPTFSVSLYFLLLFCILLMSIIAFTLLHFLPLSKRSRRLELVMGITSVSNGAVYSSLQRNDADRVSYTSLSSLMDDSVRFHPVDQQQQINKEPTHHEKIFLLTINSCVAFLLYGFLPGLQSYFTLPYGKNIFHLCINLSNMVLPFVIIFSIISYKLTAKRIAFEFSIGLLFSIYMIATANLSPCPPFLNNQIGSIIVVLVSILVTGIFTRVRCCIAAQLEVCGQNVLYIFGIVTIIGQMLGGFVSYLMVDVYRMFNELPACVNAQDYCFSHMQ